MEHIFDQLFYQHKKPLILVQFSGQIEKINKAAAQHWPLALSSNAKQYLWEITTANQATVLKTLQKYAEKEVALATDVPMLVSVTANSKFKFKLLSATSDTILLEAQEEEQTRLPTLLHSSKLQTDVTSAILNGIEDQLLAVLDANMCYIAFNSAYKEEYARIFAVDIAPGDPLLDTLKHLPGEQEKIAPIWQQVLAGKEFTIVQTFGHANLSPTTYNIHFYPLKDQEGHLMGVLYRVKDIGTVKAAIPVQESEKSFHALAENTPDIVVRLGADMKVLYANSATKEEIGANPEEVAGKSIYELPFVNSIPESYVLKIKYTFSTAEEQDLISTYNNNGVMQDYYSRFIPEKDAQGEVVSVIVISRNISSLNKAQKELQQARDFVFMADVVPQLLWISEPGGDVSFFNKQWYTYTGLTVEQSLFWGWQLVIHPDELQTTLNKWLYALEHKTPYQIEYRMRRHDGQYRWFMSKAMPLKNEKGEALKWYGFCTDIHDQKQSRTELSERVQEFELLNQMIPQIVWSTQPNGDHEYYNQRWHEYTGLSYEISKDKGWSLVLHPDDYERTQEVWNHSLLTGEIYQIEYRLRRKDGNYRWFIGRAIPLRDHKGHIVKWFGTCTDIQDYKQQREELSQKNTELQQINAYLDQFVHTAAHDLRSPVANMKLLYEMLQREESEEKRKKLLDTFKPLLNRLDNTIIGLVEIVQMQETHSTLVVQAVDPNFMLEEIKEEFADKIESLQAQINQHISLEKPLYYLRPYLQSILRNLISNSLKYHDSDRPLIITVRGEWRSKFYCLSVTDTGSGIDLQRHSKNLFKPFKRLTQKHEGLGIGLHMVQNMVQRNGGHLEVSSEPGKGTCFTLFLNPYEYQSSLI